MAFENIFYEITAILLVASVVGVLGLALRQPLIVSLLAAGILVGPSGTGLITSHDQIELLAHIGISLLLFVVGLKLDLHLIRTMGKVALATGLGQVIFTSIFGFFIALGLGLPVVAAVYVEDNHRVVRRIGHGVDRAGHVYLVCECGHGR